MVSPTDLIQMTAKRRAGTILTTDHRRQARKTRVLYKKEGSENLNQFINAIDLKDYTIADFPEF